MKRWLRRVLSGGLLLALLWAPTLGLMHRHAHATQAPQAPQALDALFGHHADGGDCRLFDKCSAGDTLPQLAAPALPPAPAAVVTLRTGAEAPARRLALVQARGPPPAR